VAIYLGMMIAVVITPIPEYLELFGVLAGATVMTLFGLWDDRRGMRPIVKIIGQAIAAGVLIWSGIQITLFVSPVLNVALTFFWVIGICNAINFQDNMDGLAAGLSLVASAFFFVFAFLEGLILVSNFAAATMGASIGFLYYNFNPASLFMGDAGSMLLGFILAVLGIKLEFTGQPLATTWMIPILILGVPVFDSTLIVISRLRRGKPIYLGGKDHTSHRLVSIFGMPQTRSVMTLYMVTGGLGMVALILRESTIVEAQIILVILVILFIAALVVLERRFTETPPPPEAES